MKVEVEVTPRVPVIVALLVTPNVPPIVALFVTARPTPALERVSLPANNSASVPEKTSEVFVAFSKKR